MVWQGTLKGIVGYTKKNRVSPPVLSEPAAVRLGELSTAARSLEWECVFRVYPTVPFVIRPLPTPRICNFLLKSQAQSATMNYKTKIWNYVIVTGFLISAKEYEKDV